jgi:O-antigen ligase
VDPAVGAHSIQSPEDLWETEAIRRISFRFCLAALFLRLSVLPELIYYVTHYNTYLLYLVGPLAMLSTLVRGGIQRTFRSRASYYWLGFVLWMILATPFSSWRGGSAGKVFAYVRVEAVFLVLVGGLALNWSEVRSIYRTIAAAAVANLLATRLFERMEAGRMSLPSTGSIGNSNDLAAQLLLVLPFVLYFMLGRGRSIIVRLIVLGLLFYGLWIILATASRGALVGLAVVFLCLLIHASLPQRVLLVLFAGAAALVVLSALPSMTVNRLSSLFGNKDREAEESAASRKYLFQTSVKFTFEHPVFGVGPGEFGDFEGLTSRAQGLHGNWHATHCVYTQVSSECGLPAFFFFVGGLGSAMLLVGRTYRRAKIEGYPDIANACFCYLLAMAGHLTSLLFLAQAYTFRLPAMVGLAVTLGFAAERTMKAQAGNASSPGPVPAADPSGAGRSLPAPRFRRTQPSPGRAS